MDIYQHLYIDGQWRLPVRQQSFASFDPSDESVLAQVPAASAEDIELAVQAARRAFDEGPWPRLSGAERATLLRAIAAGIRQRLPQLAELEVR
ncbi:MAG TPA: aldehyde dehydrogenase family protein, partial [Pseudomonas sp.]|nr:aldehyde dehydrogenase family protein [Pseudomonas sp.]